MLKKMLKHKCPNCGNDLGYKWRISLYNRGYHCSKCKVALRTPMLFNLTLFLTFYIGILLANNVSPMLSFYKRNPQMTIIFMTFICIMVSWFVFSTIIPIRLKVDEKLNAKKKKK